MFKGKYQVLPTEIQTELIHCISSVKITNEAVSNSPLTKGCLTINATERNVENSENDERYIKIIGFCPPVSDI